MGAGASAEDAVKALEQPVLLGRRDPDAGIRDRQPRQPVLS